jgi:CDP-glycerol glycerophosphotransferase
MVLDAWQTLRMDVVRLTIGSGESGPSCFFDTMLRSVRSREVALPDPLFVPESCDLALPRLGSAEAVAWRKACEQARCLCKILDVCARAMQVHLGALCISIIVALISVRLVRIGTVSDFARELLNDAGNRWKLRAFLDRLREVTRIFGQTERRHLRHPFETIGARRLTGMIVALAKLASAMVLSKIVRTCGRGKGIWLIAERPDEARDNAYHFFKHVRTHHSTVDVHYVISRHASDRQRIAQLGQIIEWRSFRHYLYWCLAECVISTHPGNCAPDPNWCWRAEKAGLVFHVSVYLKHGITAINRPEYFDDMQHLDLIAASTVQERDFFKSILTKKKQAVQMLGLCRFDALHEPAEIKHQILLMPTWRRWFRGLDERLGKEAAITAFRESEYFRSINSILTSERLHSALEQKNHHLILYPHYQIQELLDGFSSPHDRVWIADRHRYDVQQLLKESSILVTDFSSVSFDFAYMGKPVVYFLPDEERYFSEHFRRGYFNFERDGFGPVTRDVDSTVAVLEEMLRNGGDQSSAYKKRVEHCFPLRDSRNCERTMAAVEDLVARRK